MFECRPRILVTAAGAVLLQAVAAEGACQRGESTSVEYQLVYEAPSTCPTKESLVHQVNQRLVGKTRLVPLGSSAGMVTIAVQAKGGRYTARISLVDPWEHVATREYEGPNCESLADDIAVGTVAAIESVIGPRPPCVELGAMAGPDWRTNLAAWGGGVLVGLHWPKTWQTLQLGLGYWTSAPSPANGIPEASIRSKLISARLTYCPFDPAISVHWSLPLCAGAEGGLLSLALADSSENWQHVGWATIGLSPQIRWTLYSTYFQVGPKADLLIYPHRLSGKPPPIVEPSQREVVHTFRSFGIAVMATIGFRL